MIYRIHLRFVRFFHVGLRETTGVNATQEKERVLSNLERQRFGWELPHPDQGAGCVSMQAKPPAIAESQFARFRLCRRRGESNGDL